MKEKDKICCFQDKSHRHIAKSRQLFMPSTLKENRNENSLPERENIIPCSVDFILLLMLYLEEIPLFSSISQ